MFHLIHSSGDEEGHTFLKGFSLKGMAADEDMV